MTVEITNADYTDADWDLAYEAGGTLMSVIADISFHHIAPGDGWDPQARTNDTVALVAEVREHLMQIEKAAKVARVGLAHVERTARLRAARRVRSSS